MNRNLKVAIVLSGKTQRELSFDTRIPETQISNWCAGAAGRPRQSARPWHWCWVRTTSPHRSRAD